MEVFDAEIRSQHVLSKLLLQLLLDLLSEPLVHERILGIQLREHYEFETSDDPLFCQLHLLHYLVDFLLLQAEFLEVGVVDVRGADSFILKQLFESRKVVL